MHLPVRPSIHPPAHLSIHPFNRLSIHLQPAGHPSTHPSIRSLSLHSLVHHPFIPLTVHSSVHTPSCPPTHEAIYPRTQRLCTFLTFHVSADFLKRASTHPSTHLTTYLSVHVNRRLSVHTQPSTHTHRSSRCLTVRSSTWSASQPARATIGQSVTRPSCRAQAEAGPCPPTGDMAASGALPLPRAGPEPGARHAPAGASALTRPRLSVAQALTLKDAEGGLLQEALSTATRELERARQEAHGRQERAEVSPATVSCARAPGLAGAQARPSPPGPGGTSQPPSLSFPWAPLAGRGTVLMS